MLPDDLSPTTAGAWLLTQSKSLDVVRGAERLENIAHAGKIGRLYNVLRRGSDGETSAISADEVANLSRLSGIDVATRREGLRILADQGRVDIASDGSVAVLGATTRGVLETTSQIFDECSPTADERALVHLSEKISDRPLTRTEAEAYVGDNFRLTRARSSSLLDLSKATALIDEESDRDRTIVFNANVFRDGSRAKKAYYLLESLSTQERALLREADELVSARGAVYEADIERMLGKDLHRRLIGIGYFDRMEVNNSQEAVGYLASPNSFQRFGRPFEEDPIDDAKALLASLTYGMERSAASRGNIRLPLALLNALVAGRSVGPVSAIGQDYKELERRGVVHVFPDRFAHSMTLLKPDVGQLALAILTGARPAEEAILLGGGIATGFSGPSESREAVRKRKTVKDQVFTTDALDRIRSGG